MLPFKRILLSRTNVDGRPEGGNQDKHSLKRAGRERDKTLHEQEPAASGILPELMMFLYNSGLLNPKRFFQKCFSV